MAIDARIPLPTTKGWLPAGMIEPGDELFNYKGEPVKVTLVQPFENTPCYKLWTRDGLTLIVDEKAAIPSYDKFDAHKLKKWTRRRPRKTQLKASSPQEIMDYTRGWTRIPVCRPLDPPDVPVVVDPYTMGWWILQNSAENRTKDYDMLERLKQRYKKPPDSIPEEYLLGSFQQRLQLLKGMLSTRKSIYDEKRRRFLVWMPDVTIGRQFQALLESMGVKTSIGVHKTRGSTWVAFRTILKLAENQELPKNVHALEFRRVTKIEEVPSRPCVFIKTEDPVNAILAGEGFITVIP